MSAFESGAANYGTDKQHALVCVLARQAGYERLVDAVAECFAVTPQRAGTMLCTWKDASRLIDWLKVKCDVE